MLMTRDEAEIAASNHRASFGDDVILHDPDDAGDYFVCEDCGWLTVYVPDADGYPFDDEDDDSSVAAVSGTTPTEGNDHE